MKSSIISIVTVCLLSGCGNAGSGIDTNYICMSTAEYKAYKYKPIDIPEGTIIQVLSYSSGPSCTSNKTYFYQYIGVTPEQDTVRILCACETVEAGKMKSTGTFTPFNKMLPSMLSVMKETGIKPFDDEDSYVVFNKKLAHIESGDYRTAIGSLSVMDADDVERLKEYINK